MKVSALGEILVSARPLTIFCSSQPLPLPNALVQVIAVRRHDPFAWPFHPARFRSHRVFERDIVDGGELEDFELALAVGGDDGGGVADLLAQQRAADGRGGGDEALGTSDSSLVTSL
jgi:hypothetical protein